MVLLRMASSSNLGHHVWHFFLTPTVQASSTVESPSTVVVVSSMAHFASYPEGLHTLLAALNNKEMYAADNAYCQSKLANILFAQELAMRVKNSVLVNSVHPGGVISNLLRNVADQIRAALPAAIGPHVAAAVIVTINSMFWDAEIAVLTSLYASVGPELKKKKTTSAYFQPIFRTGNASG